MAQKKEPVEISCSGCGAAFRLWVPEEMPNIRIGVKVGCVLCGAQYSIKKTEAGYDVKAVAVDAAPQQTPVGAGAAAQAAAAQAGTKPAAAITDTILMIEDDKVARAMSENQLSEAGISVIMAKNANEAMKVLKKQKISLIVSDLHLKNPADPESTMDGEELLRSICDLGNSIPAIITTGKDLLDDMISDPKWFDLHVKGFIQKGNPFWVEELKLKIKEVLFKD
ncbi:MAG: response regulator [Deltaproteobacteria bacterium]|nr:response regulator [Deltaproteobacteria bacterium]